MNISELKSLEKKGNRDGYGEALVELGSKNRDIVVLAADLAESTRAKMFAAKFPERFFNVGIAEQNMVNVAAGLSIAGMIPNISSFGIFLMRGYEQMRNTVANCNLNVKIAGSHCGLNIGEDGNTQMGLEEIAAIRCLPNFTILWPADYNQAKSATFAMNEMKGPVYLQFGREKTPVFTSPADKFIIGNAQLLKEGSDITIIASGDMVFQALLAAEELKAKKIDAEVINIHTIKPLDETAIIKSAKKTGAVITAEEHQKFGGLGSAVAETLSKNYPVKMAMAAIDDKFGESGASAELLKAYGLTADDIVKKALKVK